MAGAPTIIAQSCPSLLASAPNTRLPTLVHLRATIAANGQPTVVADLDAATGLWGTTPGVSIAETANDSAIYDVTFPPCRGLGVGTIVINVLPPTLATDADHRESKLDKTTTLTAAKLGKFRFSTVEYADADNSVAIPPTGSEIHLSFWADLG
jgi:hypothetical protein